MSRDFPSLPCHNPLRLSPLQTRNCEKKKTRSAPMRGAFLPATEPYSKRRAIAVHVTMQWTHIPSV